MPTLLDVMHVPAPADGGGADFLSGQSLVPDVFLVKGTEAEARPVFIDMPAGPYNDARRALIDGDTKLIVSNDTHFELYDLAADPEEAHDLWGKPEGKDARDRMAAAYAATKARLREIKVTGERK